MTIAGKVDIYVLHEDNSMNFLRLLTTTVVAIALHPGELDIVRLRKRRDHDTTTQGRGFKIASSKVR